MALRRRTTASLLLLVALALVAWAIAYGIWASGGEPMLGLAAVLSTPFFWAVFLAVGALAAIASWLGRRPTT